MQHRNSRINLIGIMGFLLVVFSGVSKETAKSANPPNVLFITVDDLRPQLKCYGHEQMKTPNMDALAEKGVLFERAYAQSPLCGPSRASLLTGLYPDANKVYGNGTHFREYLPDIATLPQHFKNNGYYTVGYGKIFHDTYLDPVSWNEPPDDSAGDIPLPNSIAWEYRIPENKKKFEETGIGMPYEAGPFEDEAYCDGRFARKAMESLEHFKTMDKPFFLGVGFAKPHFAFIAPEKYWEMYDSTDIQLAEITSLPENYPDNIGAHNSGWIRRKFLETPKKGPFSRELQHKLVHGYYACVSYIDAQVGKIVRKLEELDLMDNTIIILVGDHGYQLYDHGIFGAHILFEKATRTPLIIYVPGITKGNRISCITDLVDVYPSLCSMAGIPVPTHCQGIDFSRLMTGNKKSCDREVSYQVYGEHQRAIRTDRYRYIEIYHASSVHARQLYDLKKDPEETVNIAGQEPELVDKLHEMLTIQHNKYSRKLP